VKYKNLNALLDLHLRSDNFDIAVAQEDRNISYSELLTFTCAVANQLKTMGLGKGSAIIIYADRSIETIASILAVLKIGAFYVPVSTDVPVSRLKFIYADVNASLVLHDLNLKDIFNSNDGEVAGGAAAEIQASIMQSSMKELLVRRSAGPICSEYDVDEELAYVIYTSGTTGNPKGVAVQHKAIASRYYDWQTLYGLNTRHQNLLQVSNIAFDVFTGDWIKMICSGGRLVICPIEKLLEPSRLHRIFIDERIDYIDIVPAIVRILVDYLEKNGGDLSSVAVLNCGADLWTKEEYFRFKSILKVKRLINGYGVTECSVESVTFENAPELLSQKRVLPIGFPLASDRVIIVGNNLEPLPINSRGEICIGGPCLAKGYVNRPDLNETKFFFHKNENSEILRFYRTGDLGAVDENGCIEFFGREDYQVKINGIRVELHDIESVFENISKIKKAIALVDSTSATLFVAAQKVDGADISEDEAMRQAAAMLPKYMLPKKLFFFDQMPLTKNGKIDRASITRQYQSISKSSISNTYSLPALPNAAAMIGFLEQKNININRLVKEFVKFRSEYALCLLGCDSSGCFSSADKLNVGVILREPTVLKRGKRELFGSVVNYETSNEDKINSVDFVVSTIQICLSFVYISSASKVNIKDESGFKNIDDESITIDFGNVESSGRFFYVVENQEILKNYCSTVLVE
jgi:amino acid adenylation domain-containing protein